MSDVEEDPVLNQDVLDDDEDEHGHVRQDSKAKSKRREYEEEEAEEEEEEDEDEEEEEEEEEEEDAGAERGKKRAKHRHKRNDVNRFFDVEAEVDEDEEEDEDEDEYGRDGFIADAGAEGDEDGMAPRAAVNARLNLERELNDQDLAKIAADFSERYKRTAVRYTGDMNEIPQRLLMPSVHDANLWQVRVKPGKERDLVFSLMRKAIDLEFGNRPLHILSAFQRDSLPGMIYVEARSAKQVQEACNGLVGIYPSRGIILVPIEEMASLLQIKKQEITVTPGSWVRIRRGKYQGDLAQVMDITENGEEVGLKFIPRIDLNPKDEASVDGKKRKKIMAGASSFAMRPPQRFFNYEEAVKVYGRKGVSKRNQVYVFQNDTYKDGFVEKDFKISALQLDDVNPTLDEITRFTRGQDGHENDTNVDLSIIAEASKKAAIAVLQPGDHVEVFEGEQAGVHGTVHSIEQDIVTMQPVGVEFDGQRIQVPARGVRKRFKPGDHVKVMTGKNSDETGLVVSVMDNVVTFLSDMSMQEVSVFSKDLREAAEVGTGTNIIGNYELHDLVQLDMQTVGVIFKTERDSFRVLDQNGQVRLVQPHQISMRRDSNRAIASDSEGHELRVGDNVKETDGEGRKGRVIHTHQSFYAFLFNRDYAENSGVFVTRARTLVSLAPKSNVMKLGATDLSKMNPALSGGAQGGMVGSGNITRGPRDRSIGALVRVIKGPRKGYVGTVKDTNGNIARVELSSGGKIIMIEKTKISRLNPDGSTEPLEAPGRGGMGPPRNPYNGGGFGTGANTTGSAQNPYRAAGGGGGGGGQTPSWSRTPNPYASGGGRTPAWTSDSRTSNPYSNGGKTPAWNAGSRTPNPHADGGKTPAWSASSRTPNPYASGGGSNQGAWGDNSTPKPSYGGATPNGHGAQSASSGPNALGGAAASSSSWGGATPGRGLGTWGGSTPRSSGDAWGGESTWNPVSAPTPAWGAPTPGVASAPTPGGWGGAYGAPTPMVYGDMATPAGDAFGSAPGPAARDEELSEKWLTEAKFQKPGVLCEIRGTTQNTTEGGWQSGEYEGDKAVVLSVFDSQGDKYLSRARINLFEKQSDTLEIPVQYLRPVHPDRSGQDVIILAGDHRGEAGSVRDVILPMCLVIIKQTHLIAEFQPERLVRQVAL